tara:strand:+ start:1417 stop:2103 length:687 start_codon:yes stop_codon:yes gene_type:complete
MNGFLLVNKPEGITSYDVIRKIKTYCPKNTKIGHSGTLDPFAKGLLIIAIGRKYTKQLTTLLNIDKTYEAEITCGIETDSYDIDGNITYTHPSPIQLKLEELPPIINKFKGTIKQTPPIFSAKKINGKPAYKHARSGETIKLNEIEITIYEIIVSNVTKTTITISVHCSKGTYIRSLAYDIGKALGTGAYLTKLNRTSIGNIHINSAIELTALNETNLKNHLLEKLDI